MWWVSLTFAALVPLICKITSVFQILSSLPCHAAQKFFLICSKTRVPGHCWLPIPTRSSCKALPLSALHIGSWYYLLLSCHRCRLICFRHARHHCCCVDVSLSTHRCRHAWHSTYAWYMHLWHIFLMTPPCVFGDVNTILMCLNLILWPVIHAHHVAGWHADVCKHIILMPNSPV